MNKKMALEQIEREYTDLIDWLGDCQPTDYRIGGAKDVVAYIISGNITAVTKESTPVSDVLDMMTARNYKMTGVRIFMRKVQAWIAARETQGEA